MADYLLEFEKPLEEIEQRILAMETSVGEDGADAGKIRELKEERNKKLTEIYGSLSRWQRVQLARHPNRPYSMDYIKEWCPDFTELHGDRHFADDTSVVCGLGSMDGVPVFFVGQQKGRNTKQRQKRNFGMANPEGYRKALRLMRMAEKFGKTIVCFIDTPGAFPGLEAEERGQGEAIARNIIEMFQLKVPVICIIIGEGASGGALGIGVGDRVLMLENTWYSVISPENCSTILWKSWDYKEQAADALKLTANDMLENKLIDEIIKEPVGGAHSFPEKMYRILKKEILKHIEDLESVSKEKLVKQRMKKFSSMGVIKD